MAVFFKLSKCSIANNKSHGKWFAHTASTETMSYRELCRHIAQHNSVYGEDVCLGVANKLASCIMEQLMEGKKVQFGELGTFYLQVKSKPSDDVSSFSAAEHVGNIFLRFAPSHTAFSDFSSKTLRKRSRMVDINTLIAEDAYEELKTENANNQEGDGL